MRLVHSGDAAAFEALYDRHHPSLLAVCRHMLGGVDEAEDALQHTFLRAHRALLSGQAPAELRPWLFAIARNRCRTLLAARREATPQGGELEPSLDGLIEEVHRRAELRELVADISRLPDEQRGALVLAELGDLSHREIGVALGVATTKVKALVFQAREALVAERAARATPCAQIRQELDVARGGALRRGPLRRHLRQCPACRGYRAEVARLRAQPAVSLPMVPSIALKAGIIGAAGATGGPGIGVGGLGLAGVAAQLAVVSLFAGVGVTGGTLVVDPAEDERKPRVATRAPRAQASPLRQHFAGNRGVRTIATAGKAKRVQVGARLQPVRPKGSLELEAMKEARTERALPGPGLVAAPTERALPGPGIVAAPTEQSVEPASHGSPPAAVIEPAGQERNPSEQPADPEPKVATGENGRGLDPDTSGPGPPRPKPGDEQAPPQGEPPKPSGGPPSPAESAAPSPAHSSPSRPAPAPPPQSHHMPATRPQTPPPSRAPP